ncbi:MAG: helix-turn-helix domain-containing protein [Acidobacteriota bacterium]
MKEQLVSLISEMIDRGLRFSEAVNEFERRFILEVLERSKGNQTKAAQAMGIHRNTLNKKLTAYGHVDGARPNRGTPRRNRKLARTIHVDKRK